MKIGVLDIQGSVAEHLRALERAGSKEDSAKVSPGIKNATTFEIVRVKKTENLCGLAGLIIPGGESTTIGKLMKRFGLTAEIIKRAKEGMVIWGTCAGAILLAKKVLGGQVDGLKLMDIAVERNAYGRQVDSFETDLKFAFGVSTSSIPAVFIRGPKIVFVGDDVEILASFQDEIVAARQGKFLATTFHPEMTQDLNVHRYFLAICRTD